MRLWQITDCWLWYAGLPSWLELLLNVQGSQTICGSGAMPLVYQVHITDEYVCFRQAAEAIGPAMSARSLFNAWAQCITFTGSTKASNDYMECPRYSHARYLYLEDLRYRFQSGAYAKTPVLPALMAGFAPDENSNFL